MLEWRECTSREATALQKGKAGLGPWGDTLGRGDLGPADSGVSAVVL